MSKPFSLALISDLLEENWPSMDLVSDMLYARISKMHSAECEVSQLRPSMRHRISKLPVVGGKPLARNADRLANRFIDYPRWLRKQANNFEIFHLIDHSYSQLIHELPPGRTVVTCHDLDTFRCLLNPSSEPRSRQFRLMTRRILTGLLKAAHVLCVSDTVRQELLNLSIVASNQVSVVPNGVDPSFSPTSDQAADSAAAGLIPQSEGPYLLSVGSSIARKRLDVLLKVFASVRKSQPVRLVRVGGPFTPAQEALIDQLQIRSYIRVLPFLSSPVLASVYRRATLTLLTSDTEGFGLPLIEAMACGCRIVASDIPVLREIGGYPCHLLSCREYSSLD